MDRIQLGSSQIEVDRNLIHRDGSPTRVTAREMDLLSYLIEKGTQVATRDELLENVWTDVVVNDEALTLTVSRLRRVLGDDSRNPSIIETIPKKGYRLMQLPTAYNPVPRHRSLYRSGWFWATTMAMLFALMAILFSIVRKEYARIQDPVAGAETDSHTVVVL